MTASQYAPGQPLYDNLAASKGIPAANAQWQWAIDQERAGTLDAANAPDPSFWDALGSQVSTDGLLGAPLQSLNSQIGANIKSFLKSPWVVVTVGVIIFAAMGGFGWLGKKVFKS